jgi:YcaO-like protein with predicted kinase domain
VRASAQSWGARFEAPVLKTFKHGTHRTARPDETLARYRHLAPRMGITRLGNVTGLDCIGIPVAIAVRPNSRSVSVAQGKGATLTHALASALMEAIEGFHAEELDARFRMASVRELTSEACISDHGRLSGTSRLLPRDMPIPWIEGLDLSSDERCWVPAETVHLDTTLPPKTGCGYFLASSNGLASGNHLLEAISAGICEVVERDAVALWTARTLADQGARRLDLASVDVPDCRRFLDAYDKAGMAVRVWNVTSDVGIAAFICDIFARADDPSADLPRFRGAGCHPSSGIALARALSEAAQVRLTHIAGIRDDLPKSEYKRQAPEKLGAALLDYRSRQATPCAFQEVPDFEIDDLAVEVRWQVDRLRQAGMHQVIVVDLTRAEFAIPVVKVVVPGLEGHVSHPDYRPGGRATSAHCGML